MSERAGAEALVALMREIFWHTENVAAGLPEEELEDIVTPRDYVWCTRLVEKRLAENLARAPAHRQGFLRAVTEVLSLAADGCSPPLSICSDVPPFDGWDPLEASRECFEAERAIQRARG